MANFYYQSEQLGRVMYLADIEALNSTDLLVLRIELEDTISDIKGQMYQPRDTEEFDKVHSMGLKINVCEKFLSRVRQVQSNGSAVASSYHLSYFRQAVSALIGPLKADQLYEQAKQDALRQLTKEANS